MNSDNFWNKYQKTGSYEDMTQWLKHAAYERIEYEIWLSVVKMVFDDALVPLPKTI